MTCDVRNRDKWDRYRYEQARKAGALKKYNKKQEPLIKQACFSKKHDILLIDTFNCLQFSMSKAHKTVTEVDHLNDVILDVTTYLY